MADIIENAETAAKLINNYRSTIERIAFNQCSNLTEVYYEGSQSDWSSISIDTTYADQTLQEFANKVIFNYEY